MHVCMYDCMYVCMHVCCIYVCVYVCTYACMYVCIYAYVYQTDAEYTGQRPRLRGSLSEQLANISAQSDTMISGLKQAGTQHTRNTYTHAQHTRTHAYICTHIHHTHTPHTHNTHILCCFQYLIYMCVSAVSKDGGDLGTPKLLVNSISN